MASSSTRLGWRTRKIRRWEGRETRIPLGFALPPTSPAMAWRAEKRGERSKLLILRSRKKLTLRQSKSQFGSELTFRHLLKVSSVPN